jgi:hypothetical protein
MLNIFYFVCFDMNREGTNRKALGIFQFLIPVINIKSHERFTSP